MRKIPSAHVSRGSARGRPRRSLNDASVATGRLSFLSLTLQAACKQRRPKVRQEQFAPVASLPRHCSSKEGAHRVLKACRELRTSAFTKSQSGNQRQERASGRTFCRCRYIEATPPPLQVFVDPAELPLCAALGWRKYL